MNDREFLEWVADRLVHRHGDPPNVDYVQHLREIAVSLGEADTRCEHRGFYGIDGLLPRGYVL